MIDEYIILHFYDFRLPREKSVSKDVTLSMQTVTLSSIWVSVPYYFNQHFSNSIFRLCNSLLHLISITDLYMSAAAKSYIPKDLGGIHIPFQSAPFPCD